MEMSTYQLCRKSRLVALVVTAVKPARAHLRTTHSTIIPRAHDLITKRRFKCTLLSTTIPSKGPCGADACEEDAVLMGPSKVGYGIGEWPSGGAWSLTSTK